MTKRRVSARAAARGPRNEPYAILDMGRCVDVNMLREGDWMHLHPETLWNKDPCQYPENDIHAVAVVAGPIPKEGERREVRRQVRDTSKMKGAKRR